MGLLLSAQGQRSPRSSQWLGEDLVTAALGEHIEYHPTGTGQVMKELGEGTRDIVVSTTGWDIDPRALGIVPAEAKVQKLKASIG